MSSTKKLRPIMFAGTGSDVGKSAVATAFCRIFKEDGYNPAPFKAQNMSLNSYATKDGLEIGRAQAVQAEACKIDCSTDMNPVLLKPTGNLSSQVVLHGKPAGNKGAKEYFFKNNKEELFTEAKKAFDRLKEKYNPIVMEGAGSISEMNLWDRDIVNMRMAKYAGASVFLVADIDRGGVFASVYGSIALLPEDERNLIKGIIINKFRGDISLFKEGKEIIESITKKPVVGILPYFTDIFIEQEDSVFLDKNKKTASTTEEDLIKVGVILLKSISNFTDFNMLERTEGVHLFYISDPKEIEQADILIIPGSKNTIADLIYLRESGLARGILKHYDSKKPLYGICGGYQMMGETVRDPKGIEGNTELMAGLGIFPIHTVIQDGKTTEQRFFSMLHGKCEGTGYEIHSGITHAEQENPLCLLDNGQHDGYFKNRSCWGSYLHGIFDNACVIESIIEACDKKTNTTNFLDYSTMKEENYTLLAKRTREYVDMSMIYKKIIDTTNN